MNKEYDMVLKRVSNACWHACSDCPEHHDLVESDLKIIKKALRELEKS